MAAHSYWRLNLSANNGDGTYLAICELGLKTTAGGSSVATGGTASASSTPFPWFDASMAFDGDLSDTSIYVGQLPLPIWLSYQFASAVDIVEYTVTVRPNAGALGQAPAAWTLEASDDGSSWTTIDTRASETGWAAGEARTYTVPRPAFDGLYGDGLYGEEYYSARVQAAAGPTIVATADFTALSIVIGDFNAITAAGSMAAQAAVRLRTAGAAIIAVVSGVWNGGKFWDQAVDINAPWTGTPDTASDPWAKQPDPSSPWTPLDPGGPQ